MSVVIVTGSAGLIGSQAVRHFAGLGFEVVGIDNDMRARFFGSEGSTLLNLQGLIHDLKGYVHHYDDVRQRDQIQHIFKRYQNKVSLVIHAASQPSHDWAARDPFTDFDVNAVGTLNVLESARRYAPDAVFIHCSSNKVYGDRPNRLPFSETETRWEPPSDHRYHAGIDETMAIDASLHSVFGASKVAADVMVQEYGRYWGMNTVCFRGGTLTGSSHAAAELHGFLAYLVRCAVEGRTYNLYGYKGKMVRDVLHARDVITAFEAYWRDPRLGEVYNLGGGLFANVSHLEAFPMIAAITGREVNVKYFDHPRVGDHRWWVSDMSKFRDHYPQWQPTYTIQDMIRDIHESGR